MIPVMPMAALAEGEMTACRVAGEELLIVNANGQYFALTNFCSHAGQRLSAGRLDGYILRCPLHRASFDVRTGAALAAPATEPLKRYPVLLDRGRVHVVMTE